MSVMARKTSKGISVHVTFTHTTWDDIVKTAKAMGIKPQEYIRRATKKMLYGS
jgi:hypothetical protein